jgi:hypothetical protein
MGEKQPTDLGKERLRRREPTDIGGLALAGCLREAVAEQRITPQEAMERLEAYTNAYAGKRRPTPPDTPA